MLLSCLNCCHNPLQSDLLGTSHGYCTEHRRILLAPSTLTCGRHFRAFAWLCRKPSEDDIGVFHVATGTTEFVPNCPPESTEQDDDDDHPDDPALRAIVRRADRSFAYVYRSSLVAWDPVTGCETTTRIGRFTAAAFDRSGGELALATETELRIVALDARGRLVSAVRFGAEREATTW